MGGYIGSSVGNLANAAERKQTYSITTSTTSLTGLAYTPTKVHVFHNGVRLVDGTDYTATNGTSITLTNAAQNGDEVVVISYPSFQTSDTVSAANGGTFAGNVQMSGTLDVTGNTTVGGTLGVTGATTLSGNSTVGGTLGVTGKITSTAGITFGSDTAAANVLNDAEEGTFTPVFGYSGGNGTGSWGYSAQYGFYQKIGNMVWYSLDLRFTSFSKGSASGTPQITGLPYNAENNSGFARWGASQVALYQWPYPSTDGYYNLASMLNGSTALQLSYQRPNLPSVDQVDPDGDSMAFITGFYKV